MPKHGPSPPNPALGPPPCGANPQLALVGALFAYGVQAQSAKWGNAARQEPVSYQRYHQSESFSRNIRCRDKAKLDYHPNLTALCCAERDAGRVVVPTKDKACRHAGGDGYCTLVRRTVEGRIFKGHPLSPPRHTQHSRLMGCKG